MDAGATANVVPGASALIPFLLAGIALVATPGPATLTIAGTSAAYGVRQGFKVMAGLISSMMLIAALAAAGLTALILSVPGVAPVASVLAAGYLLWLAWRIATAPPMGEPANVDRAPSYVHGFLLNFVNPKAYAAAAALFGGFVLVESDPVLDAIVKAVLMLLLLVSADLFWIGTGRLLTRLAHSPRAGRAVNLGFAAALVASVAVAAML